MQPHFCRLSLFVLKDFRISHFVLFLVVLVWFVLLSRHKVDCQFLKWQSVWLVTVRLRIYKKQNGMEWENKNAKWKQNAWKYLKKKLLNYCKATNWRDAVFLLCKAYRCVVWCACVYVCVHLCMHLLACGVMHSETFKYDRIYFRIGLWLLNTLLLAINWWGVKKNTK